jgi:hypothetical protein
MLCERLKPWGQCQQPAEALIWCLYCVGRLFLYSGIRSKMGYIKDWRTIGLLSTKESSVDVLFGGWN